MCLIWLRGQGYRIKVSWRRGITRRCWWGMGISRCRNRNYRRKIIRVNIRKTYLLYLNSNKKTYKDKKKDNPKIAIAWKTPGPPHQPTTLTKNNNPSDANQANPTSPHKNSKTNSSNTASNRTSTANKAAANPKCTSTVGTPTHNFLKTVNKSSCMY